jgi:inward rectifier potassium channel
MKPGENFSRLTDVPRDLGFGTVAARESRERFLNRDGTFNVQRKGIRFGAALSLYHSMLTMSWPRFLATLATGYMAGNVFFAMCYLACGPGALAGVEHEGMPSPFWRAFFFSVQTFSTIGYGHVSPFGFAANIVVTIESLGGLLLFTIATGMLFARISRPSAKILFSERAVIAPYRGIHGFMFRIANARSNQIVELRAKVYVTLLEGEGAKRVRGFHRLRLEYDDITFFPLNWTIVHPIDEASPLASLDAKSLAVADAEFLILLTGIDDTFSQTVQTRSSYKAHEIAWGAKFADMYEHGPDGERTAIDLAKLDDIERSIEPKKEVRAGAG